jgi:hypothetical protein
MITLIPIEPLSPPHGALVVEAFNRLLIDGGGQPDGYGNGWDGDWGDGWGYGRGWGTGAGDGYGKGWGSGKIPEAWRVEI